MKYQRLEYPRPQFRRDEWQPLNGEWEFAFDDGNDGLSRGIPQGKDPLGMKINVPFSYQYAASGIGDDSVHEVVWYRRKFDIFEDKKGKSALLCFNAVDYMCDVYINGVRVGGHTGGFSPFSIDITQYIKTGENTIAVRCYDPLDPTIPRGKQSWTGERYACWYIPNTGIWQSVWIEYFERDAINAYSLIPDIDSCSFGGDIETLYGAADEIGVTVDFNGKRIKEMRFKTDGKYTRYRVSLMEDNFVDENMYWTPETPNLIYVDFALYSNGKSVDLCHTRFGMRKISIDNGGHICLNNRRLYQRLVLDQGYWKDGGLTPISAEELKSDIEAAIAMGFNGARKHQKFEDPYFYYYAEELGFLSWCEMPSAYNFNAREIEAQSAEWQAIVREARNYTSVVCYVPLNESWGVRKIVTEKDQQDYARAMYYLTHALDESRIVSTNDGWENIDCTDIISIHDYAYDSSEFADKYFPENYDTLYPQGRKLMSLGCKYGGQPALFTEFGGIAMQKSAKDGNWGYGKGAANSEELYARIDNLMRGVYACPFQGFCYTQLTDVQQEVNGLLDRDHKPKVDFDRVKKSFTGKF